MLCPRCQNRLKDSQYLHNEQFKSCPECSRRHGVHAYYPLASFGMRVDIIQSWCLACRGGKAHQPHQLCP